MPSRRRSSPDSNAIAGVRIIGGAFRGRTLAYSGDLRTRPMKDRVREAVFNLLADRVRGKHVIDLFAGTGALAFEALSRGAASATLIERHLPTTKLIQQNAKTLGVSDRVEVCFSDTFVWRKRMAAATLPLVVFCSPPYDFYVSRRGDMLELLSQLWGAAHAGSVFAVEADERFDFSLLSQPELWFVRAYPPAVVGIGEKG
ncbi:MAG TPA: RsmD family RNA methyltransferase [Pirellulaceae bacterium]|nr:RsmD family RNA methyltransferase [Pirellulaceae bacterium]